MSSEKFIQVLMDEPENHLLDIRSFKKGGLFVALKPIGVRRHSQTTKKKICFGDCTVIYEEEKPINSEWELGGPVMMSNLEMAIEVKGLCSLKFEKEVDSKEFYREFPVGTKFVVDSIIVPHGEGDYFWHMAFHPIENVKMKLYTANSSPFWDYEVKILKTKLVEVEE